MSATRPVPLESRLDARVLTHWLVPHRAPSADVFRPPRKPIPDLGLEHLPPRFQPLRRRFPQPTAAPEPVSEHAQRESILGRPRGAAVRAVPCRQGLVSGQEVEDPPAATKAIYTREVLIVQVVEVHLAAHVGPPQDAEAPQHAPDPHRRRGVHHPVAVSAVGARPGPGGVDARRGPENDEVVEKRKQHHGEEEDGEAEAPEGVAAAVGADVGREGVEHEDGGVEDDVNGPQ